MPLSHDMGQSQYRSTIARSSKNNSKNQKNVKNKNWRQKNKNKKNYFLQHFVTSKLFKVILLIFLLKNEN